MKIIENNPLWKPSKDLGLIMGLVLAGTVAGYFLFTLVVYVCAIFILNWLMPVVPVGEVN